MKKMLMALALTVLLCNAATAAVGKKTINVIGVMPPYASLGAIGMKSQIAAGNLDGARATAQTELDRLESEIGPALKAAHGHHDLELAVKAFYLSASAFFKNAWADSDAPVIVANSTAADLKRDMDTKAQAMALEAKLAGI